MHQQAVLEATRRLLGDEHPQTLAARSNLAMTLKAQGDLSGARVHQQAVLEARHRLLGEKHPDTLTARLNLAGTLYAQGDQCCRAHWLIAGRASWLMGIRLGGALSAAWLMAQIDNAPAS